VFCVTEIDGVPVPAPASEAQIEALVERLGEEGLTAVAETLRDGSKDAESEDNVGNWRGTPS
jgi:hypothetical protein